jgi:hypothetical protein
MSCGANMTLFAELVPAVAALCGLMVAQAPPPEGAQRDDLDRLLTYLDKVTDEASYGFECSLLRLTAEPGANIQLARGFDYLQPFLDGKELGPLAICVGVIRGSRWYVDTLDRRLQRTGNRERHYFDGAWTIKWAGTENEAWVMRRYFDPGLGMPPWLLLRAGEVSVASWIRAAAQEGRLHIVSMPPDTTEPAGIGPSHLLRFADPSGGERFEIRFRAEPQGIRVQRLTRFRDGKRVSDSHFDSHQEVDGLLLPTTYRIGSSIECAQDAGTPPSTIYHHWQVTYTDRGPDPASFLAGLNGAHRITADRSSHVPIHGLEQQITRSITALRAETAVPPPMAPTVECLAHERTRWPNLPDWVEQATAKPTAMPYRETHDIFSAHLAVVVCARLQGADCPLASMLEPGPEACNTVEGVATHLTRYGLDYQPVRASVHDIERLRDPFVCITPRPGGRLVAVAAVNQRGQSIAWSLPLGIHTLSRDREDPAQTVMISRRDAAHLRR